MMLKEIETVARRAILEAGDVICEKIGHVADSWIENKGPADYVTIVDQKCELIIMEEVRNNFPDHHIMSEETANDGLQAGYTWVIDPLDGTTNFIHGFPFVAVSIAVCRDRVPILGFVYDPVRKELFSAKKGEGAWLNGSRLHMRADTNLEKALIATGFPFRRKSIVDPYLKAFKSIFMEVSGIRRAGAAALDLAYLGAGRVDGFWEIGLKAWDIAAGALIVQEAGGIVSDFAGENKYLYSGNVVGGTPAIYPFLLEQVQRWINPALEAQER